MDLERIPESHWFLAKLYIPILYTALSYRLHNIGLLMDDIYILSKKSIGNIVTEFEMKITITWSTVTHPIIALIARI